MNSLARIGLALCLALSTAHAQTPEAPAPEAPVEAPPGPPRLSEEGGAEALAILVDLPWEELDDGEARDFPALTAHWTRVSGAFFAYSGLMAQGDQGRTCEVTFDEVRVVRRKQP